MFYDNHLGQEKTGKIETHDYLLKIFGLIFVTVGSISQGFVQLKLDMLVSILPEDFRGTLMQAQASATVLSSIVYAIYLAIKRNDSNNVVEEIFSVLAFFFYCFLFYKNMQAVNKLAESKRILFYLNLQL